MPGSAGRPCPAAGSLIPWRSWGGWVFNGGHLEWGGGGSPARGGSRSMHSSTIDAPVPSRAVLRVPHMRSTARPRRIGSVVVLCMLGAPRPVPGRTAPPSGAAVTIPRRARDPSPGRPHPPSGAAVKPPGAAAPPQGTTAPPSGARRYPPRAPSPDRRSRPRPPGTDARRNRPHGRRRARPRKPLLPAGELALGGPTEADRLAGVRAQHLEARRRRLDPADDLVRDERPVVLALD